MKKKIVLIMTSVVLSFAVIGCGGSNEEPAKTEATEMPEVTEELKEEGVSLEEAQAVYQEILDEYSQKIKDATPGLVEEFNTESAELSGDVEALANLSTEKVQELAKISTEGIEKMAVILVEEGDKYENYEEWALKLEDVYTEYAQQITDAYMSISADVSVEDLQKMMENLQQ